MSSTLYITKADFLYYHCKGMTPEQVAAAWLIEREEQQKEKAARRAFKENYGIPPTAKIQQWDGILKGQYNGK